MTNPVTVTAPEGLPYVEIVREFDAPVAAVFRAHRDPDLYAQWIGPDNLETTIERHDFKSRGSFRFGQTNVAGDEFWFSGVFHAVRDNELAIQTFEFEGAPDQVSLEFLTFTDLGDGRSRLSGKSVFPSLESRDAMVENGMEHGVTEGYERLDSVLAEGPAAS